MAYADGFIDVRFDTLAQGATDLALTHQALVTMLEQLEADLQSTLADWTSDAQQAYYTAKAKWTADANDMATVLGTVGARVGEAHQNYTRTEMTNLSIWTT